MRRPRCPRGGAVTPGAASAPAAPPGAAVGPPPARRPVPRPVPAGAPPGRGPARRPVSVGTRGPFPGGRGAPGSWDLSGETPGPPSTAPSPAARGGCSVSTAASTPHARAPAAGRLRGPGARPPRLPALSSPPGRASGGGTGSGPVRRRAAGRARHRKRGAQPREAALPCAAECAARKRKRALVSGRLIRGLVYLHKPRL